MSPGAQYRLINRVDSCVLQPLINWNNPDEAFSEGAKNKTDKIQIVKLENSVSEPVAYCTALMNTQVKDFKI